MRDDQHRFLTLLGRLPARLTVEQVSWVLNCQPHDIPILIATRLLKPLGNPPANGIKFFASKDLLEMMEDRVLLAKISNTITQHWHQRNLRQKSHSARRSQNSFAPIVNSEEAA